MSAQTGPPPVSRAAVAAAGSLQWPLYGATAFVVWMGVHALRTFWSMLVWNVAEDRSPPQIALIAFVFWTIGLLAWFAARWFGGPRPAVRFALLFGLLYAANQAIAHPLLTPALGIAMGVLWLWLLPTFVVALSARGAAGVLMPGILLGLAAQVTLQTALHGLDMPVLHGLWSGAGGMALAAALYASFRIVFPPDAPRSGDSAGGVPGWGLAALGPYLLLQLTLLCNEGRIAVLTGWSLPVAAGFILLGLAAGSAALVSSPAYAGRVTAAVLAVLPLLRPAVLAGSGVWLLLGVQGFLSIPIADVLAPAPGARARGVFGGIAVGAMLFFILTFLYYRRYGVPSLWLVMAALAVLPAIVSRPVVRIGGTLRAAAAVLVIGIAGLVLGSLGRPGAPSAATAPAELKIFDYNIHEAFNVWSTPDPEAAARAIELSGADLVGLQEVGRGWNINGGPDLVAWLRWRFPQYRVVFTPLLGDLVGIAVLSRYPVSDTGSLRYARRQSRLPYGLQWATLPTPAGDLLFINTHLSPYPGFERDRTAQANDLLKFWLGRDRTVVVGDFNAGPDEEAIRLILAAGLVDVSAAHGLGDAPTYPATDPHERRDYIFSSRDVESLAAAIPKTTASDHLPFEARVRLR